MVQADDSVIAGRYRVVRWLGGGGMGNVYEVVDAELGETVALKMLGGNLREDAVERFRREVRLTRRIRHANVARMFDIGEHAGGRFLTMELVDGEPLSRDLGRQMPWMRLQPIAQQVCAGLAAAHAEGVIHRDLKPHNVMIERVTGRAVVTDFGIARSRDDVAVTLEGELVGTPSYMAPEQLAGETGDARSDLFALGVMLFELASAQRPWPGKSVVELARARATQPPRAFGGHECPPAFGELVMRLMAISPAERPATAEEAGLAIAACESGATTRVDAPISGGVTGGATVRERPARPRSMSRDPGTGSIAVMHFTAAPDDLYVADGMVEDLIDTLSTSGALRVRPAGARADEPPDPVELGRRLGVDHVVSGSLRRVPTGLRVSARLTSVGDRFQIWAKRTETTEAGVLALADELAGEIARALSTRATAADRPTDPRAVDLYLRARAELRLFWGTHLVAAANLLEEASAIAPTSAAIQGACAFATAQAWTMQPSDALHMLARARAATQRALVLGHGDAFLASSILRSQRGDLEGGAEDLATALARAPMSPGAHEAAGTLLNDLGLHAEARFHFETAVGLEPGRIVIAATELARTDMLQGNHEAALARLSPLLGDPRKPVQQVAAMNMLRFKGWRGDLMSMLPQVLALDPPQTEQSTSMLVVSAGWAQRGRVDDTEWQEQAAAVSHPDRPQRRALLGLQLLAELAAVFSRPDLVFEALERSVGRGLVDVAYLEHCPLFAPLDPGRLRPIRERVADRAARVSAAFRAATNPPR